MSLWEERRELLMPFGQNVPASRSSGWIVLNVYGMPPDEEQISVNHWGDPRTVRILSILSYSECVGLTCPPAGQKTHFPLDPLFCAIGFISALIKYLLGCTVEEEVACYFYFKLFKTL